jgi:hypothetical protein
VEIHKPKPWHGWREFLKEYLIIVVGVLTALAAEQAVEWLHWQHQLETAREAIKRDQKSVVTSVGVIDGTTHCTVERLQQLDQVLERASSTGRLPALGVIGGPSTPPWRFRAWDTVVSGGLLPHMGRGEGERYAVEASLLADLRQAVKDQFDIWSSLRAMSGSGRRLSDEEAASLRRSLQLAWKHLELYRSNADYVGGLVVDTRVLSAAEINSAWRSGYQSASGPCTPIGNVAAPRRELQLLSQPPSPPSKSGEEMLGLNGLPYRK